MILVSQEALTEENIGYSCFQRVNLKDKYDSTSAFTKWKLTKVFIFIQIYFSVSIDVKIMKNYISNINQVGHLFLVFFLYTFYLEKCSSIFY